MIIIGKNHPLGQKEDLQLRDLDNRVFIDMLRHDISKNGFLRSAVKIDTNKTITTNTSAVRYRLIQRGLGYTVGRKPNRDTIERYQLRCIPIPELSQPLFAVTNPNRPVSEEVQRFFEFLEDEIKDPSAACSDL